MISPPFSGRISEWDVIAVAVGIGALIVALILALDRIAPYAAKTWNKFRQSRLSTVALLFGAAFVLTFWIGTRVLSTFAGAAFESPIIGFTQGQRIAQLDQARYLDDNEPARIAHKTCWNVTQGGASYHCAMLVAVGADTVALWQDVGNHQGSLALVTRQGTSIVEATLTKALAQEKKTPAPLLARYPRVRPLAFSR